jgi:flagellar secretion chaperone FliS
MAKPWQAYQENRDLGWTRIDMILAVFDGIVRQLEQARADLARGDPATAKAALARAQIGIAALAAGAGSDGHEISANFLRLYEFASRLLSQGGDGHIDDALRVLSPLREGFEAVRQEARALERNGIISPLLPQPVLHTSA